MFTEDVVNTFVGSEADISSVTFAKGSILQVRGVWEQLSGGYYVQISESFSLCNVIQEHQFKVL